MKSYLSLVWILVCSSLLISSCKKGYRDAPKLKIWHWQHVRYNTHQVFDSYANRTVSSNDTVFGNGVDTIFFVSDKEVYFHKLNYYLNRNSDSLRTFEHVIYDSGDPVGEMSYYFIKDSVFLSLHYYTSSGYVSDEGVEYWWTQR
jgi:hypothetical protein